VVGATIQAPGKVGDRKEPDPCFMSPGDFGYLEHLDTREGHHEGGHA